MIFGIESDVSPARIKSIAERAVTVFTAAYGSAVWFQTISTAPLLVCVNFAGGVNSEPLAESLFEVKTCIFGGCA